LPEKQKLKKLIISMPSLKESHNEHSSGRREIMTD
jgi:hypothetical protein